MKPSKDSISSDIEWFADRLENAILNLTPLPDVEPTQPTANKNGMVVRRLRGIGRQSETTVDSTFQGITAIEQKACRYYREVFNLIPANPNKPELVDALDEVFVGSTDELKEKIDEVNECTTSQPILLVGGRGAGKSTLQNQYLNNYNEHMMKNRMVWVRCDAYKLYSIWEEVGNSDFSIDSYLTIQLAYVVAKYSAVGENHGANGFFVRLVEELTAEEIYQNQENGNYRAISVKDAIENLRKDIVENERRAHSENESYVLRIVRSYYQSTDDTKPKIRKMEFDNIRTLGAAIESYLYKRLGVRMLKVVDGIDNIMWHKAHRREHYWSMLKELTNFATQEHTNILVLSMRPETVAHMIDIENDLPPLHRKSVLDCPRVDLPVVPLGEIFKRKYEVCLNPSSQYFKNLKSKVAEKREDIDRFASIGKVLGNVIDDYIDMLADIISDMTSKPKDGIERDNSNIVTGLFGNDIRAMTRNMLSMLFCSLYSSSIRSRKDSFQRWLYRNLFLGGNLYKETQSHKDGVDDDGGLLPNIFWYDTRESPYDGLKRWYGLCGLRVLQIVASLQSRGIQAHIERWLTQMFDYEVEMVRESIDRFVLHGLLSYKVKRGTTEKEELSRTLILTPRGEFTQNLIFRRIDMLYFIALDTPLMLGDNILAHSNNEYLPQLFYEACIYSSSWLMRHIYYWQYEELEVAKGKYAKHLKKKSKNRLARPQWSTVEEFEKAFRLPTPFPHDDVRKSILKMLRTLSEDEGQQARFKSIVDSPSPIVHPKIRV